MKLLIKKANPKSLSHIVALEKEIFGHSYTQDYFDIFFQQQTLLVAYDGELLIGMIGWFDHAHFAEVVMVGVHSSYRNQGVGSMLMKACISLLVSQNKEALYVEVRQSNFIAKQMYITLGFESVRVKINYYEDPNEDALEMRLTL